MADDDSEPYVVDPDEAPLFDIGQTDEPDTDGERGGAINREGVSIPWEIAEFGNGKLPDELLVPIGIYRHRLHASAAAAFARLREAAAGAGIELTCTDSYRPYEEQVDLKRRKPHLAATPGKSVHGWGFAVDVSVGLPPRAFGHSVYRWLQEHGPEHGWHLGRPKDEPWHWVYRGPIDTDITAPPTATTATTTGTTTATTTATATGAGTATPTTPSTASDGELPPGWELTTEVVAALLGRAGGGDGVSVDADLDGAVREFQAAHGLLVDGVVGPVTTRALWSATAPVDRPVVSFGAEGEAVRWIQRRVGTVADGDFGPLTDRAVRAFQSAQGLVADGIVGPLTWAAMTGAS